MALFPCSLKPPGGPQYDRSNYKLGVTMGVKSVETLGSKIRFSSVLDTFLPSPRNNVDIYISSTAHTTAPTQH